MVPNSNLDQVILVDDQDREIGVMDKVEAHRGQGRLHRAISVFLFNNQGQLLLQQRSSQKIVGAGQWANTCCGNVRPGESYEECAHRRLQAELGIEGVALTPVLMFQYAVKCNAEFSERELDQIFVGKFNDEVQPNPAEVSAWRWANFEELIGVKGIEYAPWFCLMMEAEAVLKNIKKEMYE